jgi:endonuclease/exonuclease/phosphatase family metal-dependent hydrolase
VKRIDPRVAVRADLATPAGILRIVCTHTSRDDCQTRRVADLARDNPGALPVVLMGDLNTGETAPALHELLDAGFVDVFRAANADAPGATVWQDVNAPVATVRRRVDYVLLWPGRAVSADIRSSRIVLNRPRRDGDGTTLWPSDHYGIFAEIALVPRSPQ